MYKKGRATHVLLCFIKCSCPEHSGGLGLGDDNALEERNRLFETFLACHVAILMLNGHNVVVTNDLKCGNHFLPCFNA